MNTTVIAFSLQFAVCTDFTVRQTVTLILVWHCAIRRMNLNILLSYLDIYCFTFYKGRSNEVLIAKWADCEAIRSKYLLICRWCCAAVVSTVNGSVQTPRTARRSVTASASRGNPLYGQPDWWGEDDHLQHQQQQPQKQQLQQPQQQQNIVSSTTATVPSAESLWAGEWCCFRTNIFTCLTVLYTRYVSVGHAMHCGSLNVGIRCSSGLR